MKLLPEATFNTLSAAAELRFTTAAEFRAAAERLAGNARAAGFVVTIEQQPLHPLAMGHHADVVAVREVRAAP